MPRNKTNNEFLIELKTVNPEYIPLEKYKNNTTKILFKCIIHNIKFYTTPKVILRNVCSCPQCISESKRNRLLKTNEYFLQELTNKNIDVIPLEEYKGNTNKILFKCSCGNNWITTPERVLLGNHCKKCGYSKFVGENNHFYNLNLTKSDRENSKYRYRNPKYKLFRDKCFERDSYMCRVSGKISNGDIVVHHLNGFNWDKFNRTNIANGITLNKDIHKEFHKIYGKGNNTKEQFLDFINKLYFDNKISEERFNSLKIQINKIK